MYFNPFGQKGIRENLKDFSKAKYNEYRALKQSNKFMKEVGSWEGLKKWIGFKAWTIRPNGVPEQIPVRKVFITIEDGKVTINGELMDGSYISEAVFAKESDVLSIAKDIAAKNMDMLKENLEYYMKEIRDVEAAIARGEKVLAAETAADMKEAAEVKEASKERVDEIKEKLVKDAEKLEAVKKEQTDTKKSVKKAAPKKKK